MTHFLLLRRRLGLLKYPRDRIKTHIKIFQWGPKGQAHEVMARRVEEIASVGGIDVEENARDDDSIFFQELLKESLDQDNQSLSL